MHSIGIVVLIYSCRGRNKHGRQLSTQPGPSREAQISGKVCSCSILSPVYSHLIKLVISGMSERIQTNKLITHLIHNNRDFSRGVGAKVHFVLP